MPCTNTLAYLALSSATKKFFLNIDTRDHESRVEFPSNFQPLRHQLPLGGLGMSQTKECVLIFQASFIFSSAPNKNDSSGWILNQLGVRYSKWKFSQKCYKTFFFFLEKLVRLPWDMSFTLVICDYTEF